jgi:hypothetical protein
MDCAIFTRACSSSLTAKVGTMVGISGTVGEEAPGPESCLSTPGAALGGPLIT